MRLVQASSPSYRSAAAGRTARHIQARVTLSMVLALLACTYLSRWALNPQQQQQQQQEALAAGRPNRILRATEPASVEFTAQQEPAVLLDEGSIAATAQQQQQPAAVVDSPRGQYKRCRGPKSYEVLPRLVSVRQWRSARARGAESITLVTQLSLERLEMLGNQCGVWPGPLAAAVYIPTLHGAIASWEDLALNGTALEAAVVRLAAFHERMELEGRCTLDLELASQDFDSEQLAALYPFNAARNRALQLAGTEALLLLDADFVPSPALAEGLNKPEAYAELIRQLQEPRVIVLPAFETKRDLADGQRLALDAVQGGKAFALAQYRAGSLLQFAYNFPGGHRATDYERWASQDVAYQIEPHTGFEPFVLVSRRFAPWYDERFRGYGWDKISYIMALFRWLNMRFTVHPSAFVVHVPHQKAATYYSTKGSGHRRKLYKLFRSVNKDMKKHRYKPVVSSPELCRH